MKCLSIRRIWRMSIGVGILFLALLPIFLFGTSQPAEAQCGTSASSCKNCHEVQGQDSVNANGDWHTAHAFGDFCEFCHAGNVESKAKEEAHVGLVSPLMDVKASCQSCHPQDYNDKASVYAAVLGVQLNASGPADASGAPASQPASNTGNAPTTTNPSANVSANTATTATVDTASGPNLPSGGEIINYTELLTASKLTQAFFSTNDKVFLVLISLLILGFIYAIWKLEHFGERLLHWWQQNLLLSAQSAALEGTLSSAVVPMPSLSALAAPVTVPERTPAPEVASSELDDLFRRRPELRQVWPHLVRADGKTLQALATLLPQAEASEIIQRLGRLNLGLVTVMQQLSSADQALLLALARKH
ncbi:MAG: hypothetical protein U0175_14825 [Caldilineaceae bacterium]